MSAMAPVYAPRLDRNARAGRVPASQGGAWGMAGTARGRGVLVYPRTARAGPSGAEHRDLMKRIRRDRDGPLYTDGRTAPPRAADHRRRGDRGTRVDRSPPGQGTGRTDGGAAPAPYDVGPARLAWRSQL